MKNVKLGDIVWYMLNNKIHSALVLARMTVENLHEYSACTKEQKELFTPFGPAIICLATCHGIIDGTRVYASEELLVDSLLKAAY
jgi:hypothetical protein